MYSLKDNNWVKMKFKTIRSSLLILFLITMSYSADAQMINKYRKVERRIEISPDIVKEIQAL